MDADAERARAEAHEKVMHEVAARQVLGIPPAVANSPPRSPVEQVRALARAQVAEDMFERAVYSRPPSRPVRPIRIWNGVAVRTGEQENLASAPNLRIVVDESTRPGPREGDPIVRIPTPPRPGS